MLGRSTPKNNWQSRTVTMLDVLNNFMKKRLIVKSNDCTDLLSNAHTSRAYNRIDIHLWQQLKRTSSESNRPTLPKIPLAERWKERLALSIEHLNFLDRVTKTPRWRISSTQDSSLPSHIVNLAQTLLGTDGRAPCAFLSCSLIAVNFYICFDQINDDGDDDDIVDMISYNRYKLQFHTSRQRVNRTAAVSVLTRHVRSRAAVAAQHSGRRHGAYASCDLLYLFEYCRPIFSKSTHFAAALYWTKCAARTGGYSVFRFTWIDAFFARRHVP